MRFILLLTVTALAGLTTGCHTPARASQDFHVTAATPDQHIDVTGIYGNKEYALSVSRENVPMYVAYYEPIGTEDVGKDFHASLANGTFTLDVPGKGPVHYNVEAVREIR